ncbi:MAG: hypothetical protein AB9891_06530 [Anaerolineaceae bacterium]
MAPIEIGIVFTGEVDKINQESIQTKFFVLGLPLFPLGSYYCLSRDSQGIEGIRIKMNFKSVAIAYLRWWLGIGSVTGIIIALAAETYLILFPSVLGLAIAISTIWIGRLSKEEMARRQLLVQTTGMGIPPNLLPESSVLEIGARLENTWEESSNDLIFRDWRNLPSISSVPRNLLPLLFCLALYKKENQIAEKTWQFIASK